MATLVAKHGDSATTIHGPEYAIIADELAKLLVVSKETGQEAATTRAVIEAFCNIASQHLKGAPELR